MEKHETVRQMTPGQMKDLAAAFSEAAPSDLTFSEAETLLSQKNFVGKKLRETTRMFLAERARQAVAGVAVKAKKTRTLGKCPHGNEKLAPPVTWRPGIDARKNGPTPNYVRSQIDGAYCCGARMEQGVDDEFHSAACITMLCRCCGRTRPILWSDK